MKHQKIKENNGGYYAIKGFTYQFDKSLLEIINNQKQDIEIEQIQDISLSNYYIQVKYKETQIYTPSKIKPAVIQLLDCFLDDKNKKFKLYCYFKDQTSKIVKLNEAQLNKILGASSNVYTRKDKQEFINNFILEFSENFEKQFVNLINLIKSSFQLKSDEEATTYHAMFRANLLDIAIKKDSKQRTINYSGLKDLVKNKERIIFDIAYCKYLSLGRYIKYIKKEYFTFKKINIPNEERMFVVEVDNSIKDNDIIQIIENIKSRYFMRHQSPAPYICFFNILDSRISTIKQKLWDKKMFFSDGTHFNTDKFRIKDLTEDSHTTNSDVTFKLINFEQLPLLIKNKKIDRFFVFFTSENKKYNLELTDSSKFFIEHTKNIIKIIN